MSNPTKKKYSSSYTRHLKYLKSLSKLHQHYTSPTGTTMLAPPELLTQIHAQISILANHRSSSLLDPKLWSILYLTNIIKILGCAHDTEVAKDACEFKDLHELVLKRVEELKGKMFREVMSESESESESEEGKKRRVRKEVRRAKKGEISSSSSSEEEEEKRKKRRVKLVVRKIKEMDESDEESAYEYGYEPMGKTSLEEENSRVDVEGSKKGIPKSKWSRRTILGRRV